MPPPTLGKFRKQNVAFLVSRIQDPGLKERFLCSLDVDNHQKDQYKEYVVEQLTSLNLRSLGLKLAVAYYFDANYK